MMRFPVRLFPYCYALLFSLGLSACSLSSASRFSTRDGGYAGNDPLASGSSTHSRQGELFTAYAPPPGMAFTPQAAPDLRIAPGVGLITAEAQDEAARLGNAEKLAITEEFQRAYLEELLRGQELTGVLGGDLVHGWPEAGNPLCYVQNWRTLQGRVNSWGHPTLVLSILPKGKARVYTVSGPILDQYGKSPRVGLPNGAAGYGAPRGPSFYFDGSVAQWFEYGLMVQSPEGRCLFIPEGESAQIPWKTPAALPQAGGEEPEEPSTPAAPALLAQFPQGEPPAAVGMMAQGATIPDNPATIREAFQAAWLEAAQSDVGQIQQRNPDGPVAYFDLQEHQWPLDDRASIRGLYIQRFEAGTAFIILVSSNALPGTARLVGYPFLDCIMNAQRERAPGAESLELEDYWIPWVDDHTTTLLSGLALYGVPLTSPLPQVLDGKIALFQRFSKGWISVQD